MTASGPVVVVMLTHRAPELVRRLVDQVLLGNDVAVVLHHDPRGPELDLPRSSQVLVVPHPIRAGWGRIGLARAVLDSLEHARRHVRELGWALVVSGQDYPCRPMADIESELVSSPYDAYVRWLPVGAPAHDVGDWQRLARTRYLRRRRLPFTHRHVPAPRLHPFRGDRDLFIGDMWVNLGPAALDHVVAQRSRLPGVERYLARCQIPDEALLTTLLLNDATALRIANERRRFIRWTPGALHPATLTLTDLEDVVAGDDFFARKVALPVSLPLLDALDALDGRRRVAGRASGTR